jgi:hypothetical protein
MHSVGLKMQQPVTVTGVGAGVGPGDGAGVGALVNGTEQLYGILPG